MRKRTSIIVVLALLGLSLSLTITSSAKAARIEPVLVTSSSGQPLVVMNPNGKVSYLSAGANGISLTTDPMKPATLLSAAPEERGEVDGVYDKSGKLHLVWMNYQPYTPASISYGLVDAQSQLTTRSLSDLMGGQAVADPALTYSEVRDELYLTFTTWNADEGSSSLWLSVSSDDGQSFGTPQMLVNTKQGQAHPATIMVDPQGRLHLLFVAKDGVYYQFRDSDKWSSTTKVGSDLPDGKVSVNYYAGSLWASWTSKSQIKLARTGDKAANWQSVNLGASGATTNPLLLVEKNGISLVWAEKRESSIKIQRQVLDGVGNEQNTSNNLASVPQVLLDFGDYGWREINGLVGATSASKSIIAFSATTAEGERNIYSLELEKLAAPTPTPAPTQAVPSKLPQTSQPASAAPTSAPLQPTASAATWVPPDPTPSIDPYFASATAQAGVQAIAARTPMVIAVPTMSYSGIGPEMLPPTATPTLMPTTTPVPPSPTAVPTTTAMPTATTLPTATVVAITNTVQINPYTSQGEGPPVGAIFLTLAGLGIGTKGMINLIAKRKSPALPLATANANTQNSGSK